MRTRTTILWLVVCRAYETWHLVDLAQVICPKPTSSDPNAPAFGEYNVGINYTSELQVNAPHIIGFVRASKQAVSITFKVEDSNGAEVVPEKTVALQELSDAVPSNCRCTQPTIPVEVSSTYGANYGAQCGAWDEPKCGELWGDVSLGEWCCQPWCYATSDCPDAYQSQALPGQYFSYSACKTFSPVSPCQWVQKAEELDPCTCKDKSSIFNAAMKAKFEDAYGSACGAWDMLNCGQNYRPDQVDTWCCANWCYVDMECPSAIPSLNPGMEGLLYWSDNVCVDNPALMLQCPFKPQPNISDSDTSCACLDVQMPSDILVSLGLNATEYANYGKGCAPHDADICEIAYPRADHAMWCCFSWCWVNEACPTARASTVWQGHYYSDHACELDADAISSCKYDKACECRGQLPDGTFSGVSGNFAADYGSNCSSWDSIGCKAVWGSNSGWNASGENEWCCDSWCYVNRSCPIAKESWLGTGFYFSYETCDDPSASYNEATDACDAARRLSGRRRGGAWSSGSSWSSRRRSPPAPAVSPRRRSYSKPSVPSPRRRAPPPDVRRRAPPPPVPSPMQQRRRTTSVNGQTYTAGTGAGAVPYGYANRPQMMNNFGGTMPQQTPYGYSGYNAVPAQKPVNVAMYAAGGAVAGAVVGAGAMYAYNNMYSDGWEMHRRRRMGDYRNMQYCIVTDEGPRNGAFMACEQCYQLYGYSRCPSASSCQGSGGCRYTTAQSFSRDELAETGFIPKDFAPPLKVTFSKIEGTGIDAAEICPPTTEAEVALARAFNRTMSWKPELFVVLSRQDVLATPPPTTCVTTFTYSGSSRIWNSVCVNNNCECQAGYCWDGQRCQANNGAVGAGRPVNAVPESFAALLVLYILSHMF